MGTTWLWLLFGLCIAALYALNRENLNPFIKSGKRKYVWRKDEKDERDFQFQPDPKVVPPALVDSRKNCPPPYDQTTLGSCTGNGIAGALETDMIRQGLKNWTPSRLFIYFCERMIEGTINQDSGAQIRDGIKAIAKYGYCPETMWPYIVSRFTARPSIACWWEARQHRISAYHRLDNTKLDDLRNCLAQGNTIVFGMSVFARFESDAVAKTGVVPMPNPDTEQFLGGHCMLIVGYDDAKQCFIVRNSWGSGWGDGGYCYIPYAYLTNGQLAQDFWTIERVGKMGVAA